MSTLSSVEVVWVVLDAEGDVVLMCSGADAAGAAEEWSDRGYRIEQLEGDQV
jgi:hypothetical protein